jgi:hypothetical protein
VQRGVYRKRCEREGLDFEIMSLRGQELELDDGTPVPIEQPTEIKIPPLSENDQDDRVRLVFGLTHEDPLPSVSFIRSTASALITARKSSSRSKCLNSKRQTRTTG